MTIDRVKIQNFKSLKEIDVKLSNLTLLTGVNSCGKSSFIQALLLLKQNEYKLNNINKEHLINIDGDYVKLGKQKDILFQDLFEENIHIGLYNKDNYGKLLFNSKDLKMKADFPIFAPFFNLFDNDFQYIATDRIAPSISYSLSHEHIQNNLIGINGEYTAHYLSHNRHTQLKTIQLKHKNSKTEQLLENVSLWIGEISHNIEVKADIQQNTLSATISYIYTYGDTTTSDYSPLSVGFGITYVLPIIVSILKAKAGDLLVIENPESHLHPAGQSKIAYLCALASANGVQIIVETHSDHFLNSIRVATKDGILDSAQSQIYYFKKDKDNIETKIEKINIDKTGKTDSYPKGFFDQYDEDLDKLIVW